MRNLLIGFAILAGGAGASAPLLMGGAAKPAAIATTERPPRNELLTGRLEQRIFIKDCHCFPWIIVHDGISSEVDVTNVPEMAEELADTQVSATGVWQKYKGENGTVDYMLLTRLEPAY